MGDTITDLEANFRPSPTDPNWLTNNVTSSRAGTYGFPNRTQGTFADAYGSPDYPDVHREWVRREWVSGSQGLVNAGEARMNLPRLFDYGGLNGCMLLPDVPHAVCQDTNIEKVPATTPVVTKKLKAPMVAPTANQVFGFVIVGLLGTALVMKFL